MAKPFKIIDVFAGPGGLAEGFSAYRDFRGRPRFRIALSIEKEASAHQTLELRAFYRQFRDGEVPREYYEFLAGNLGHRPRDELFTLKRLSKQAKAAMREARQLTLGENDEETFGAIREALGPDPGPWVLIGGPPCQAYSVVGRSRNRGIKGYRLEDDDRSTLYHEYLKIIEEFRPAAFVMENVKGLLSTKHGGDPLFDRIISDLSAAGRGKRGKNYGGYKIFSLTGSSSLFDETPSPGDFVIRAERFGVPQARHRVILLGVRHDLLSSGALRTLDPSPGPSLEDVTGDLPRLRSGLSRAPDSLKAWRKAMSKAGTRAAKAASAAGLGPVSAEMENAVRRQQKSNLGRGTSWALAAGRSLSRKLPPELAQWYEDPAGKAFICNHETRGHIDEDLARYLFCASYARAGIGQRRSPTSRDFPKALAPAHSNWKTGKFADRFRVQVADGFATTVTSHISKDGHYFIHYDPVQCRSLTVREAARIQTFPDNYFFVGNRTQQYVQVGNAVPPWLARQIAEVVAGALG